MWQYQGQQRPPFAEQTQPGQESVWDYPRPPKVVSNDRIVEVYDHETLIARSVDTHRVLETASPPTVYIPVKDINMSLLIALNEQTFCEWKGEASYFGLVRDPDRVPVAWCYPDPFADYAMLHDHLCFYPGRVACYVEGERVRAQPGKYYGGWVTRDIVGPFKGEAGTEQW